MRSRRIASAVASAGFAWSAAIALCVASTSCAPDGHGCGDDLIVRGNAVINSVQQLRSLAGCEVIEGNLDIGAAQEPFFLYEDAEPITSLVGLESLETVVGAFNVRFSPIESFAGLDALTVIGGPLVIDSNPALEAIDGFDGLERAGGIFIGNNAALRSVAGFSSLTTVDFDVRIVNQPQLEAVDGFASTTTIGGPLELNANALRRIGGFAALTSVQSVTIFDGALEELAFFSLESAGVISIDAPLLANLGGLGAITALDGLSITNTALQDFTDLERLTVARTMVIQRNRSLASLDGLDRIGSADFLSISENPLLDQCEVEAFASRVGAPCDCTGNGDGECP